MSEQTAALFPNEPVEEKMHRTGILPSQVVRDLIRNSAISALKEIPESQIQPSSLDLRLGKVAFRVRASFLPGPNSTVMEKIQSFGMHKLDLSQEAVLEQGCVYIVPLQEHLALPPGIGGFANPKSSTGRLDIFTRLITDRTTEFEIVRHGYKGPLYAEISPRAFSILVREGTRLNQIRFMRGRDSYSLKGQSLSRLHQEKRLIDEDLTADAIRRGIPLTIDLESHDPTKIVGYKARVHAPLVDVDKIDHYPIDEYWEPVYANREQQIILNPNDFYILSSRESVNVPPDNAALMEAYDTLVGEFRAHYAGFFDPGFGNQPENGSRAVLEVRSYEVPFLVEHGQVVGRLMFERLTGMPDKVYGQAIGSSYQRQKLALSKHFQNK